MSDNLQSLLKEALLNNTYDYDAMHKTIKSSWMNSYSYLYYLQKANIGYEELFFQSDDKTNRDSTKIGKMYMDKNSKVCFDVDYDFVSIFSREAFRLSDFYQNTITFENMVYNPQVFLKIPVIMIDDKLIWDFSITIKKDCTTFILPFKRDFILEDARNIITDDTIYISHKVQILVIDNIFYQRYTSFNKNTLYIDFNKKTFKIYKNKMMELSASQINKEVNTDYMTKYGVKYASELTSTQKSNIVKEANRRIKCIKMPTQDGIMFASIHLPNSKGNLYELGTNFIELEDAGDFYEGELTDDYVDVLKAHKYNIYLSLIFINRLYKHTYYDNMDTNISNLNGAKILVIEKELNAPYDAPIPVENFMVFKRDNSKCNWYLEKNVNMLEMHYPNIYIIDDENMEYKNEYKIYYFYYPTPDLQYTVLFDFYFKFLKDKFTEKSMEEIINDIYYGNADLHKYKEWQQIKFQDIFEKILDYSAFHHKYGDTDFLERYLKTEGNQNKVPIEYKDETLKKWITEDPWILRDYVLEQNKLGSSYHLFTNTINLQERLRYNTEDELGTGNIFIFDEPRYVFAFSNDRNFPELLDCRVFVDGLLVGDVYQRRKLFMDYFYIPASAITKDSYIELEIFPRYQFTKEIEFHSLDDKETIKIIEPDENIYPTAADLIIEEDNSSLTYMDASSITYEKDKKINTNGEIIDTKNFITGKLSLSSEYSAIETTLCVYNGGNDIYSVYAFFDKESNLIKSITNKTYNVFSEFTSFRCYTTIPANVSYVIFTLYKNPDTEINLNDIKVKLIKDNTILDDKNISRYDLSFFNIVSHYTRGNFEFSSDNSDKPVEFTRLSTFTISPNNESVLNIPLKVRFSKKPIMVRFVVDRSGYINIDIGSDDFQFNTDYIRIFRNGRLLSKNRYRLLTTFSQPRIIFSDWMDVGDIVYIDITPYKYKQIMYQEVIEKDELVLVNLKKYITKPFDIRYYDVYMNGRRLSVNNIFAISPWIIALVNLQSNYNLEIYEKDRDWEYFGIDYTKNLYYFSFEDFMNSGIISDDELDRLVNKRIEEMKDERLNIYPNKWNEESLDYSENEIEYEFFYIFYFDELIPKTFLNPDILQTNRTVIASNFEEVLKYYELSSVNISDNLEERDRRKNYPGVLCLDPDIIIESNKKRITEAQLQFIEKENDTTYYTESGKLIVDVEHEPDEDVVYTNEDDPMIYNMDKQANLIGDEDEVYPDGLTLVYEVGHLDEVDQTLLDSTISIIDDENTID